MCYCLEFSKVMNLSRIFEQLELELEETLI